jgi:hypothetical protein
LHTDFLMLVPTETRPRVTAAFGSGQVTVSFPTRTGRVYTLQYNNALNGSGWQDLSPSINGDGSTHSISQPANQPARFYRLKVQ